MAHSISIKAIKEHRNPFQADCWNGLSRPITKYEVTKAIQQGKLLKPDSRSSVWGAEYKRSEHIQKIAYFVVKGWKRTIHLDVGSPDIGYYVDWLVEDGNHRLAAAIYRKDETIKAFINGSLDEARELGLIPPKKPRPIASL